MVDANDATGKVSNDTIIRAIFSTLFWGLVYFGTLNPFLSLILILAHPFIGKLWAMLIEYLSTCIDEVYELNEGKNWGDWSKDFKILFAAWWPISGPIGFIVTLIGLLYGVTYKELFK